jgi:feruloyl esterase
MAFGYGGFGAGHVGWIVYRDPDYDPTTWNLNNDWPDVVEVCEGAYGFNADTDSLVHYLSMGKKLIVWHGTDDTLLSHYDTVRTMNELADAAGNFGKNMKFYTVPGVGHCGGGVGASTFDMISALTDWVEKGKAPKNLIASKVSGGSVLFTRPLCEYPRYPRYIRGNPNDANSFECQKR